MRNLLAAAGIMSTLVASVSADALDDAFRDRFANPEDAFTLGSYIRQAVADGQYDQAISSIEEHLIRNPDDGEAYLTLARLYAQTGAWTLAAEQASSAIGTGTLAPAEEAEAESLVARAARAAKGFEWFAEIGTGVQIESTRVAVEVPSINWISRTKPVGDLYFSGAMRFDLGSALDSALIVAGSAGWAHRFEPAPTVGGRMVNLGSARAAVTLDLGLPTDTFDAARFQITGSAETAGFSSGTRENAYGASARLVIQPSVDTEIYGEAGWYDLSTSTGLPLSSRITWSAGGSLRLTPAVTLGLIASGAEETYDDGSHGRSTEGEFSVSGIMPFAPFDVPWAYRLFAGGGTFSIDATATAVAVSGVQWTAGTDHAFLFDGGRRIEVGYAFTQTLLDGAAASGDQDVHEFSLVFVQQF